MQKDEQRTREVANIFSFKATPPADGGENSLEKAAEKAKAKLQIYNIRRRARGRRRGETEERREREEGRGSARHT